LTVNQSFIKKTCIIYCDVLACLFLQTLSNAVSISETSTLISLYKFIRGWDFVSNRAIAKILLRINTT